MSFLPVWKSYLSSVPFGQPTPEASASVLKLSALQVTPQSGLFGLARSRKPAKCLVSASACSFSSRLLRCAGHLGSRPVTFTSAVSCFPRVCWVPSAWDTAHTGSCNSVISDSVGCSAFVFFSLPSPCHHPRPGYYYLGLFVGHTLLTSHHPSLPPHTPVLRVILLRHSPLNTHFRNLE